MRSRYIGFPDLELNPFSSTDKPNSSLSPFVNILYDLGGIVQHLGVSFYIYTAIIQIEIPINHLTKFNEGKIRWKLKH